MKTIWIAVVLFLVVLSGSVVLFLYTTALSNQVQDSLLLIGRAVEEENWDSADRELKQLKKIWARSDASLTPIMDHHQVDRLDESITRVIKLTELRSREELLTEVAVAMRTAKRIKDSERPTIRNIF